MKIKELFKYYQSCEYRWHLWQPVYIKWTYNKKEVKFIACKCERCWKWDEEIHNMIDLAIDRKYWTYSEEYFK
jgi:hypothetical protein